MCALAPPEIRIHVMILSVVKRLGKPDSNQSHQNVENKDMTPQPSELEQTFAVLGSNEQMVLRLRSGLVDGHRHTLREVSTFLGTTRAAARSLEWQSWQKLQAHAQSNQEASSSVYYILGLCRVKKPSN